MIEITINEAMKNLMGSCPGLYADFVIDFSDVSIASISSAYKCGDAIAIKTLWSNSNEYIWYICDTGDSNMDLALADLNTYDKNEFDKILIHAKELDSINCLIFSCFGTPYEDEFIRALNESDSEQMLSLTTVHDDDNPFSKSISECLRNNYLSIKKDSSIHTLGIFEGVTLTGAISIKNKHNSVIVISDIFVPKEYRGKGYATRLIHAALSMYPGVRYSYSCGTDNNASISSAKSAGFVFEGTYDFL